MARCTRLQRFPQEVAEMLVKNESRIKFSQAMTTYRFPRQVLLTFKLRLQVRKRVQAQLSRQPKTSARCGLPFLNLLRSTLEIATHDCVSGHLGP